MELSQHRYYRFNVVLLKLTGYWPYQRIYIRFVITVVVLVIGFSLLVPQIIAIIKHLNDWDLMMECAVPLVFDGFCFTKGLITLFSWRKMLKLLNRIHMDWEVLDHDADVNILHEYAEKGRKLTILYTVMWGTTCTLFVTQPVIPKIIDVLLKNGTEPGQFPIPIEYYYIDMQKYYFYIILHFYVYTFMGILVVTACDSIFMVYVQHGCGLFAILGRKLERIGKNQISADTGKIMCGLDKPVMAFEYLSSCIDKHNHAIEYAELINVTYTWCFFLIVGFNMIMISIIGIQIITRRNEPAVIIKLICCNAMAMMHLFIESYMAQILMDHSINIRYYILNGNWYTLPLKAQKLLPLMMMRCNIPCKLTAAKITIMSVKAFGAILKTSLSYFTLLRTV